MKRSRGRTWLTLIGMVISAGFMTTVLTANSQLGKVVSAPIRDLFGGDVVIMPGGLHLEVAPSGALEFRQAGADRLGVVDFDEVRAAVANGAGVSSPSSAFAVIDARVNGVRWPIIARDFTTPSGVAFADRIVEGRPLGAEDEGQYSIVVSAVHSPQYKVGDMVTIQLPRVMVVDGQLRYDTIRAKTEMFTVVGLYRMRGEIPGQLYLMPMSTFCDITGLPDRYGLFATACMQDFNHEAASIKALGERLPAYDVYGPQDLYKALTAGFSQGLTTGSSTFTFTFTGLMYIVSALIIGNAMLVAVSQRRREIAVMKAMGARTHQVLLIFISEGVLLSLVGALIGFGVVSGAVFLAALKMTGAAFDLAAISLRNGLTIVAVTTCAAVLASIVPAIGAARTSIMEVLRHE